MASKKADVVNNAPHYTVHGETYEPINVIEAWKLNFRLGNTVKYISRADHKNNPIIDLKKAQYYLNREIAKREQLEASHASARAKKSRG